MINILRFPPCILLFCVNVLGEMGGRLVSPDTGQRSGCVATPLSPCVPTPGLFPKHCCHLSFSFSSHISGLFEARLQSSPCSGMAGAVTCHLSPLLRVAGLGNAPDRRGKEGKTPPAFCSLGWSTVNVIRQVIW